MSGNKVLAEIGSLTDLRSFSFSVTTRRLLRIVLLVLVSKTKTSFAAFSAEGKNSACARGREMTDLRMYDYRSVQRTAGHQSTAEAM